MSYFDWHPYVSVAEKRRQAERELAKLRKRGQSVAPVRIEGRTIARTFWGKSWCTNLERYSDYASRVPRGRSYVRNGSVLDLKIAKGEVAAMVAGSSLYQIKISIAPVKAARWKAICRDCAGAIDSLLNCCKAVWPRESWTESVGRAMGCFHRPMKSSCPAAAPTGQICASTLRPRYMALARDSTKNLNFSSCCAASMKMSCSPTPDETSCEPEQRPRLASCSATAMSRRFSGSRWPNRRLSIRNCLLRESGTRARRNQGKSPPLS